MDEKDKMIPVETIMPLNTFRKYLINRLDNMFLSPKLGSSIYQDMKDGKGEWFLSGNVELPAENIKWRDCVWIYTYKKILK